jgi:hypothetical protein
MATCSNQTTFTALELPAEFTELEGLLGADLRAIVTMLAQRAHERLILTRREHFQLQQTLWNHLAEAVNVAMAPLSAENR